MSSLKSYITKLWNEYGIGAIIVLLIIAYGVSVFSKYLTSKGKSGSESMSQGPNSAYGNKKQMPTQQAMGVQPSNPLGQNETFASVNGGSSSNQNVSAPSSNQNIQNPSDLLPKNSQWSQLNPAGKGELANINLLKAGYHIGIDTVGQSLRNANLQIRSEPPNPQLYVGPWQQSTIEPDIMRVPMEIGNTSYSQ